MASMEIAARLLPLLLAAIVLFSSRTAIASSNSLPLQKIGRQNLTPVRNNFQTSDIRQVTSSQEHVAGRRHATSTEKDHAPKLIHQPQDVIVRVGEPHTIECAIEARPAPEVKWFKDGIIFESQAPHSEQQNNELMFFQVNEEDTGTYHCEATNNLGFKASDTFKLTVQSSIYDPRLRLDPKQAEVGEEQQAEFTCTLPVLPLTKRTRQQLEPEVSWKRDGKKLLVKWLDEDEELADARSRFVARKLQQQQATSGQTAPASDQQLQFALTITRVQVKDDNSTFTCLYQMPSIYSRESDGLEEKLAHESNQAILRVYSELQQQTVPATINLPDANLGPPLYDIVNRTSQLLEPSMNVSGQIAGSRRVMSLKETLLDLFEIAKPTLIIFGVLFLVSLFVMLKLVYLRHQKNRSQNRYMKHTSLVQQTYSVSSAGSGASSSGSSGPGPNCFLGPGAGGGGAGFDPMLNSLMGRTLSLATNGAASLVGSKQNPSSNGPAASSGNGIGGLSKKYRSYRDHMRKISDKNNDNTIIGHSTGGGCDFLDANFVTQLQQQLQLESQQTNQPNPLHEPPQTLEPFAFLSSSNNANLNGRPNLYNQSLAAREQARSLLQAGDHMRSLSNLNAIAAIQHQQQASCRFGNQNGSNLNLPLSFVLANNNGRPGDSSLANQLNQSAIWPNNNNNQILTRNLLNRSNSNNQQQLDEHYQLVNCSSISPSSASSSTTGTGGSSANGTISNSTTTGNQLLSSGRRKKESTSSANHYSTIETNDDEEEDGEKRYEEVLGDREETGKDSKQASFRVGLQKNSTFLARQQEEKLAKGRTVEVEASKRNSRQFNCKPTGKSTSKNSKFHDQLSPYAVSSICGSMAPPPAPKQQPPQNSEAMRALNEQFDINQLMLLDEQAPTFDVPPPPPPTTDNDRNDDS